MLKKLALALGYAKAPKTTFFVRNPKRAAKVALFAKLFQRSSRVRRVSSGLIGLGAASVAIPAGLALLFARR